MKIIKTLSMATMLSFATLNGSELVDINAIINSVLNIEFETSEAIVVFKDNKNLDDAIADMNAIFSAQAVTYKKYKLINAIHFKVPTFAFDAIKNKIENSSLGTYVELIEKNYKVTISESSNDTYYNKLWAISNNAQSVNSDSGKADADMDIDLAWDKTKGSSDVVVAVLDTGIDYTHNDLANNIWSGNSKGGYDFAGDDDGNNDSDPKPDTPYDKNAHYHGTHVAGIIAAEGNNNIGVSGVNWHIQIMNLKVFRPNGSGYSNDILEALDYLAEQKDNGVNIVAANLSYNGAGGQKNDAIDKAIAKLGEKGIIFCVAAGNNENNNDNEPSYPASYTASNIITIAASDQSDNLATFSNYGTDSVDVAAPGVNILSTYPESKYGYLDGTSMSTPYVTGLVALIADYAPSSTLQERIDAIKSSVDKIDSLKTKVTTGGRVNAYRALRVFDDDSSNTQPVANSATVNTQEDKDIEIKLSASDSDNDSLEYRVSISPKHGELSGIAPNLKYKPDSDYFGSDSFAFKVYDGKVNSQEATVTVNISAVEDAPDAKDDHVSVDMGKTKIIDVLSNDIDVDKETIFIKSIEKPKHGTVKVENEKIAYTPDSNYIGSDTVTYTIKDSSNNEDSAIIYIDIKDKSRYEYPINTTGLKSIVEVLINFTRETKDDIDLYSVVNINLEANREDGKLELINSPMPMPKGKLSKGSTIKITDKEIIVEFILDKDIEF